MQSGREELMIPLKRELLWAILTTMPLESDLKSSTDLCKELTQYRIHNDTTTEQ